MALIASLGGCNGDGVRTAADRHDFGGLDISRVVLYTSGVAYFERAGKLRGDRLSMRIRADQINDILKSLTIVDRSGGKVISASLPIERDSALSVSELPPAVRDAGGMLTVLASLRGARVRITGRVPGGEGRSVITGRVVGIDADAAAGGHRVTILKEKGAMVALTVESVSELTLLDGALEIGLRKGLDMALGEGAWKPVELTVHLSSGGEHDLVIGYVVEMPTWQPAYRLVLDGDGGDALLQGWAVVNNVSGDDWNGVKLSLAAGTPMSFLYDLHTPRFIGRPDLTPADILAMAPPEAEGYGMGGEMPPPPPAPSATPSADKSPKAYDARKKGKPKPMSRSVSGKTAGLGGRFDDMDGDARDESAAEETMLTESLADAMGSGATARTLAGLLSYDLPDPVSVPDTSTALVSIINSKVTGEDVFLFRPEAGGLAGRHPFRAARFENGTPFLLEKGPVSIYSGGTFVGEALLGRIAAGSSAFVPYALDTRVNVGVDASSGEEDVVLAKIAKGVVTIESYSYSETKYRIENKTERTGRLYVRRGKRPGWKLKDPPDGVLEEGGVYLIPMDVKSKEVTEVAVKERTKLKRTIGFWETLTSKVLRLYIKAPDADPEVARKLDSILEERGKLATLEGEKSSMLELTEELRNRAKDLRRHIESLGKAKTAAKFRTDLAKKLAEVDDMLHKRTVKLVELEEKIAESRIRVTEMLNELSFERKKDSKEGT